jgi:hypothetical protein
MDTFDRIWDRLYPIVVFIIFSAFIPFMIWGFFAQTAAYQKDSRRPTAYDRFVAEDKAMLKEILKEDSLKKPQPVQKRETPPPPQIYSHGDNDFDIPLQQLLEGNHGRLL